MARVVPKRVTAEIEGDFVVFLIGMRNKPWKVHKTIGNSRASPDLKVGESSANVYRLHGASSPPISQ